MIFIIKNRAGARRRGLLALGLALGLLAPAAAGCAPPPASKPLALATTTILADLVRHVAGERISVEAIAPAGADVEEYSPRPEDARRVADASVVFVNGLGLDRWADALLRGATASVVTLSAGLPTIEDNPHLWFDVQLAKRYVEKIRDALAGLDPADADGYARRAREYAAELDRLDADIRASVATIPPGRRVLVTSHDAFPYFAKAYGFTVIGFIQPEAGKEPSAAELAALVAAVRAANVGAVFSEAGASPRLAEALAREAGIRTVVTDLPTDSVGAAPADSYVGVMRVIIAKMVAALR